jgi:hypothetical protein
MGPRALARKSLQRPIQGGSLFFGNLQPRSRYRFRRGDLAGRAQDGAARRGEAQGCGRGEAAAEVVEQRAGRIDVTPSVFLRARRYEPEKAYCPCGDDREG